MISALPTLEGQARRYAAVRARLWPPRPPNRFVPRLIWTEPRIVPVYETLESRIAAIIVELGPNRRLVSTIIEATARVFDLEPSDITGRQRTAYIANARQIAMTVARCVSKHPTGRTARAFQKDHSCVHLAVKKYKAMVENVSQGISRAP